MDETPKLTPLLLRALRILERSRFELIAEILAEVDKNPALETTGERSDDPEIVAEVAEPPAGVRPDAFVVERDGIFEVIPSVDRLPDVQIADGYDDTNVKRQAQWFLRSLEQRGRSIEMVVRALINLEPDVFAGDGEPARSLSLKQISDGCGFHISTVERIVANKYIATAHGVWPLQQFVSSR